MSKLRVSRGGKKEKRKISPFRRENSPIWRKNSLIWREKSPKTVKFRRAVKYSFFHTHWVKNWLRGSPFLPCVRVCSSHYLLLPVQYAMLQLFCDLLTRVFFSWMKHQTGIRDVHQRTKCYKGTDKKDQAVSVCHGCVFHTVELNCKNGTILWLAMIGTIGVTRKHVTQDKRKILPTTVHVNIRSSCSIGAKLLHVPGVRKHLGIFSEFQKPPGSMHRGWGIFGK